MTELKWIKHDGGPMPVPGDTMVLTARDGGRRDIEPERADWWDDETTEDSNWTCEPGKALITEYAIVTPSPTADPVNNPVHYASGDIECIDAIKAQMTADQFAGYLRGNVVKYLWRYEHKGGAESLEKAEWYLKRLIQEARNG